MPIPDWMGSEFEISSFRMGFPFRSFIHRSLCPRSFSAWLKRGRCPLPRKKVIPAAFFHPSTSCQSLQIFFDHYSTELAPLWCNASPWMLSVCKVCSIGRESWSLNRPWAQAGNHNSTWRRWSISGNRMHRISCLKDMPSLKLKSCFLALCPLFISPARTQGRRKLLFFFFFFFWNWLAPLLNFIVVV